MQLKDIKPGRWYETTLGTGVCVNAGGTHPPCAMIDIRFPIPRGKWNVRPRDVLKQVPAPEETVDGVSAGGPDEATPQ